MDSPLSQLKSQLGARSRRAPRRGFALLITITLLAFLVILLVGLGVYTRVETSIAGNTQRQTQARQNALFGLNIAVAQLQKYAGPDQRVTMAAESFVDADGTRAHSQKIHYTGVWDTAVPGSAPVWLASGLERGASPDVTASTPAANAIVLVGPATDGSAAGANGNPGTRNTVAALQTISAPGVPGQTAPVSIGRYAWWVGDQGVKAPVGVGDRTSVAANFAYTPYDATDVRNRLRQQMALGAGAATATTGAPVFEPRDTNNSTVTTNDRVLSTSQLALLRRSGATTAVGLALLRPNFHRWSPNNQAVLADTSAGGLRNDLSLAPGLLGSAFAAWADYPAYTEPTVPVVPPTDGEGTAAPAPVSPSILPAYGSDPIRRRVALTPHVIDGEGSHQIGPVLTYFLLTFNVRTINNSTATKAPLEVRARWMISLWNPYTSAIVPEDLQLEITGLPTRVTIINDNTGLPVGSFSPAVVFGNPLVVSLPWASAPTPAGVPAEDRTSWLPGRTYTWVSSADNTGAGAGTTGFASSFYNRTLSSAGQGVVFPLGGLSIADGSHEAHFDVAGSANLSINLNVVRGGAAVRLAALRSCDFPPTFVTTKQPASGSDYQFSYVFRLAESLDTPAAPGTWLTTDGRDPRGEELPPEAYVPGELGNDPALYNQSYSKISSPDRLLDRESNSYSYNEDVPVFELPRTPLLSLGALQHFQLVGSRPFIVGNPWGAASTLNGIRTVDFFDRFFFSGLVPGVTPSTTAAGDLIAPNPLLKPLRKRDGNRVAIADVRALISPPTSTDSDGNVIPGPAASSRSSKFFVQSGAFNLNSADAGAWAAVLRGVRFPAPQSFAYLGASTDTGTADDGTTATVQSTEAQFFRFSQTAQETYKAEPGVAGGTDASAANTHLFRQGMRTLTAAQVVDLSAKIAEFVTAKHAASGPFLSLAEFLSPNALYSGGASATDRTLLEAAIEDAAINSAIPEFSSQWLTQADVLTALAPILFPRSDTFLVRAYGDALNPATSSATNAVVEGRAWCEALVQRVPEYFDPADDPETLPAALTSPLNTANGRRFKVIHFRWLTRSDI